MQIEHNPCPHVTLTIAHPRRMERATERGLQKQLPYEVKSCSILYCAIRARTSVLRFWLLAGDRASHPADDGCRQSTLRNYSKVTRSMDERLCQPHAPACIPAPTRLS